MITRMDVITKHPELRNRYVPVTGEIVRDNFGNLMFCFKSPFSDLNDNLVLVRANSDCGQEEIVVTKETPIFYCVSLAEQQILIDACNKYYDNFFLDLMQFNHQCSQLREEYVVKYKQQHAHTL